MKRNLYLLALFVLLSVVISAQATSKKTQAQFSKHKPEKAHKLLGHWGSASERQKPKSEHHSVKEVQKHAPLSVSHHDAKTQVDLGHSKKKSLMASDKGDLKLQDLLVEDAIQRKVDVHKQRTNHAGVAQTNHAHNSHYPKNGHKVGLKSTSNHASNGHPVNKREKKAPKKVMLNKSKKNKRTKRLHKQYIF